MSCRNGSQLVKEVREKKDKDKSRLRFWDMAGSKMGQITGLTNEEAEDAQKRAEEQVGGQSAEGEGCVKRRGGGQGKGRGRGEARLRFWDMAGSKMGEIMGLTNEEAEAAQKRAEEHGSAVVLQQE
jgi:hypothetical protein